MIKELLTDDEIALNILKNRKTKIKIIDLYKKVCKELEIEFEEENLTDFYELISMNKKFVILTKGYCDLQSRHKTNIEEIKDDDLDNLELDMDLISIEADDLDNEEDDDDFKDDDDLDSFIILDEDDIL